MGCICIVRSKKNQILKPPTNKSHSTVRELKMNYKITAETKVLGAGSFGKVFLSESVEDSKFKVAIKVLNKRKVGS